jgi:hypothetical protein
VRSDAYAREVRNLGGTVILLTLTALLGACGSSYTKQDFATSADAICASAVRQTRAISPPSFSGGEAQQLSALGHYLSAVVPVLESEAAQIRALRRPGGNASDRARLASYLAALDRAVAEYRQLAAAAARGDAKLVARAEAALQAIPLAANARSYGLQACANPGSTAIGASAPRS